MGVVLHQRGGQGVLERLSILQRDVLDRLHSVDVLAEAHREPGRAQLLDEAGQQLSDGLAGGELGAEVGHGAATCRRRPW